MVCTLTNVIIVAHTMTSQKRPKYVHFLISFFLQGAIIMMAVLAFIIIFSWTCYSGRFGHVASAQPWWHIGCHIAYTFPLQQEPSRIWVGCEVLNNLASAAVSLLVHVVLAVLQHLYLWTSGELPEELR